MIEGLIDRLKVFLENKTYTYIQDYFEYNFNGYVVLVKEDGFLFLDDKLGEIELNFSSIKKINFSNRGKEE